MEQASTPAESTATAVEEQPVPPGADGGPESSSAETRDTSQLLEYSREVHLGPGGDECPDSSNGSCENPMHFHAFIRLPNGLQQASIREKSEAAKARKLRLLREHDSDSRVILESELEEMVRNTDRDALIEAIVSTDFIKDHYVAMRNVRDDDANEGRFEHIDDDRERMRALEAMDAETRPEEEFEELQRHIADYADLVNAERADLQRPLREALEAKPTDELVEMVREERIQAIAREAGELAYSEWEWYIGTLKVRVPQKVSAPQERVFPSIDAMRATAPEVIDALQVAFREIEAAAGRSLQGATG